VRIISDFHDYYDNVQSYGQDRSLVYLRKEKVIENFDTRELPSLAELFEKFSWLHTHHLDSLYSIRPCLIGFCGKWYPYIDFSSDYEKTAHETAFNAYDVLQFLQSPEHFKKEMVENFLEVEKKRTKFYGKVQRRKTKYRLHFTFDDLDDFFKKNHIIEKELDFFFRHRCPIFIIESLDKRRIEYNLILHPNLFKRNFQREIDPYTAFQELSMFISGRLGVGEPVTVNISNEAMIEKKGFDKWSFRTMPTKK